ILALPRAGVQPGPYIPVGVEWLSFSGLRQSDLWVHARLHQAPGEEFEGDVSLFEDDGRIVARWLRVRFRRAPRELFLSGETSQPDSILYELHWRAQETTATA